MKKFSSIVLLFTAILLFNSCKKKFDLPPAQSAPNNSGNISCDSIVKKFVSYYTSSPLPTKLFRFNTDVNLTCTVTADEISGNIYKSVFVADQSGCLQIKLINGGGLFVGDQIRINLNNVVLNDYGDMVQLDSIDAEKKIVKINTGNVVTPTKMTMGQILTMSPGNLYKYQSKLVLLDSIEFVAGEKGKTFADPVNKFSLDRHIVNAAGQSVIVRSSGYANFAGNTIPCGKGSMVVIVGQYFDDLQLTIRDFNEVKLSNANCPLVVKTFDDGSLGSNGWINKNVTATVNWTPASYNGRAYVQCSNYVGGSNVACESWLISPAFDISSATNPNFSFQSAYKYTGPQLEVLVSTNYSSGNPNSATWAVLSATLSAGNFVWTGSGPVSLSSYKSANTRIAFKYTGTASAGSTWEVDDIAVFAE
jgi:hypothetical protein